MSGILQVEHYDADHNVYLLRECLDSVSKLLTTARQAKDFTVLDWEAIRSRVDERFDVVFDNLMLNEDEELDVIEGEEGEDDNTLHPLDPDNEFIEGFDDVC